MRQFLDRVTVTGADDSITISDLDLIQRRFPFAEFGILMSKSSEGFARFPSRVWLQHLAERAPVLKLNLSAHLCGRWVRRLCQGDSEVFEELGNILDPFQRIQLNFHSYVHAADLPRMFVALEQKPNVQYIFQLDGVNDELLGRAAAHGLNCVGLFDLSGGAGVLPESWPKFSGYYGYAGGLSPENVAHQLNSIERVADPRAWIDAETHVRTPDNLIFDWRLVCAFLEATKPRVIKK